MCEIIAVVSGKGGTGKTTFTSSVGIALAEMGYHTLCLDCDITLRNLDLALGLSDRAMMNFNDVLYGRCKIEEAVVAHDKYKSLDFLTAPSCGSNDMIDVADVTRLRWEITEKYDYCLVDAPAGMGAGFQMAIQLADRVVLVTNPDSSALRDAQRTVMELKQFPEDKVHLVINKVDKQNLKKMHRNLDEAIDTAGIPLLGVIPNDKDVPVIMNQGLPLREFNYNAGLAFINIAKRIAGQDVPLMLK